MTRISLVEAYDDKDVITQIAKMKDKLDSIPDDADLSNCVLKVNNQIIDGRKTFNDVIVANDGIAVTGDLNVDGNIVQSGAAVEVHVEEIYTKNDYIVLREDAATAIPPGQFSGLQITKYNGLDNGRMVMDQSGTMRVGDVGQEEPLATRDEVADMTSGALVKWDGVNMKMIAPSSNVGSDSKPVKIVNGEPVAVTTDLQTKLELTNVASGSRYTVRRYGPIVIVNLNQVEPMTISGLPIASGNYFTTLSGTNTPNVGTAIITANTSEVRVFRQAGSESMIGSLFYITTQ